MLGPKSAIERRMSTLRERWGHPIPSGGKVSPLLRIQGGCEIASRPRTMLHPQRYSPCFLREELANHIPRGNGNMGWTRAVWAVAHFGPSGGVCLSVPFARPGAGSIRAHQTAPAALASVEQKLGRLEGHGRKSQLGIGRYAGWRAHLSLASEDFYNFPKARHADPRRGGIQIENATG